MSRNPDPRAGGGPNGEEADPEDDGDLDGQESFPASDPPAHWGGEDHRT